MFKPPTPPEGIPRQGYSGPSYLHADALEEPIEYTTAPLVQPSAALRRAQDFRDFPALMLTAQRLTERLRMGDPTAMADAYAFEQAINNPVGPKEMKRIATERGGLLALITKIYTALEPQRTITPGPSTILGVGRRGIRVRYINHSPKPEQTDQA